MDNVILYQSGGRLVLDEPFLAKPSACTLTLRTMANEALSSLDSSFDDVEAETAEVEDLVLTLAAGNAGATRVTVSSQSGTDISDMTDRQYRLLLHSSGRRVWLSPKKVVSAGGTISTFDIDEGLPFDISAGDTATAVRCKHSVDMSSVTGTYTGPLKATWTATVGGQVQKLVKVYYVVKQVFLQPATWRDVLIKRPDAASALSRIHDREALVEQAWNEIQRKLDSLGIRTNLIVPDGDTALKDATVNLCIYNMIEQGLMRYQGNDEMSYLDRLGRDVETALGGLRMYVDDNEDEILTRQEGQKTRKVVFFKR